MSNLNPNKHSITKANPNSSEYKKIEFITFGCRLNHFESKTIEKLSHDLLNNESNNKIKHDDKVYFINSCAVTNEAVRQLRQKIRSIKKNDENCRIIVSGCAVEQDSESLLPLKEVDAYLGNIEKLDYKSLKNALISSDADNRFTAFGGIHKQHNIIEKTSSYSDDKVRANIKIQNGCDHDCTFCVIPNTRGKSRSVSPNEIIEQISNLVGEGFLEVILTGVDIADYGKDFKHKYMLGNLVGDILENVKSLQRLRLSSIDVDEIDEGLVSAFKNHKRLMPHVHLSLQSGDNLILKRMKRRHSREDAIDFCKRIKNVRPDIVFGADFIVGFPTETEEKFQNSLKLIDECDINYLHVFPFSPRPGTKAALMPQIERQIIKERAKKMRKFGEMRREKYYMSEYGKVRNLLIEKGDIGKTEQFTPTILVGKNNISEDYDFSDSNRIIEVKVVGADNFGLKATPM